MGMAENTRERGREQAGMTREGRRTMEKVLENTVRDTNRAKACSEPKVEVTRNRLPYIISLVSAKRRKIWAFI